MAAIKGRAEKVDEDLILTQEIMLDSLPVVFLFAHKHQEINFGAMTR